MAAPSRTDHVDVPDGTFDRHVWLPPSGAGPGLLLLQEIFGVGPYIRSVGERLAALGYVVAAPDVFWRITRNWEAGHDEAGLGASVETVGKFDFEKGVADCVASLDRLRALPEVAGGAGVIGFCLGGLLTFHVAAQSDPAVAISYYGSNIAAGLGLADKITNPIQFHFGDADPYIPNEQVTAIAERFAGVPTAELHVQFGAGHAFDNHEADMFWNAEASDAAWRLTTGFLAKHLPTS